MINETIAPLIVDLNVMPYNKLLFTFQRIDIIIVLTLHINRSVI